MTKNKDSRGIIDFYLELRLINEFSTLFHLLGVILALPHGSISIESVFSQVKLVKSEKRNCLSEATLEALLLLKDSQ